jgi:hypothetical protein
MSWTEQRLKTLEIIDSYGAKNEYLEILWRFTTEMSWTCQLSGELIPLPINTAR